MLRHSLKTLYDPTDGGFLCWLYNLGRFIFMDFIVYTTAAAPAPSPVPAHRPPSRPASAAGR